MYRVSIGVAGAITVTDEPESQKIRGAEITAHAPTGFLRGLFCRAMRSFSENRPTYSSFSIVVTSSQLGHWKVASSESPPSLGVILTSFIPCPQYAQGRIFCGWCSVGMAKDAAVHGKTN